MFKIRDDLLNPEDKIYKKRKDQEKEILLKLVQLDEITKKKPIFSKNKGIKFECDKNLLFEEKHEMDKDLSLDEILKTKHNYNISEVKDKTNKNENLIINKFQIRNFIKLLLIINLFALLLQNHKALNIKKNSYKNDSKDFEYIGNNYYLTLIFLTVKNVINIINDCSKF